MSIMVSMDLSYPSVRGQWDLNIAGKWGLPNPKTAIKEVCKH